MSGPVVLAPNVIHGAVRFANVNPAVLAILQTEGMSLVVVSASSQSPEGYSASSNYLTPITYQEAAYQLSAEASGGVGSVSYWVDASAWVNQGALSGGQGLGTGAYRFERQSVTLQPTSEQPTGVALEFSETVGVVRIRFGTDSTCNTPVAIRRSEVLTSRGFNYLNHIFQPGYSMGYYLMPGGMNLTATITTTVGTSDEVDTLTFRHTVEFNAGPDEIQDVCIPIPTGAGSGLGSITTPFDVIGHTIVPNGGRVWAWDGPQGNQRLHYLTGASPEAQPSTWLHLPNMAPGDYSLYSTGLLDWGDSQVSFGTQYTGPPWTQRTTVIAGQSVDARQSFSNGDHYPFVSHPAHFQGNILLYDRYAESHPGAQSSLSSLSFHTLWPHAGFPGGTLRGPGGGSSLVSVWGNAYSITSFAGRFQPTLGKLTSTYSLPIVALYDQPEPWSVPSLNLRFGSERWTIANGVVTDIHYDQGELYYYAHPDMAPPATYRQGQLSLSQTTPVVTVQPQVTYPQDHRYCFNEVRLRYTAASGTFVNPVATVTGGFTGPDFEESAASYTGQGIFYGTPAVGFNQPADVFLAGRATQGLVSFALPQGNWHVSPGASFVNADGTFSSGNFPSVDVTMGCGQRVDPLPGLAVSITAQAACTATEAAAITGTVSSGDAPIDHIWYTLDGQSFDLCTADCTRDFTFPVPRLHAGAALTVYATSPWIQGVASVSDTVPECSPPETSCLEVHLGDYNLFLLGDYSGGHDVEGRVAAGGDVSMTDFSVGARLPDNGIANTLVAGHDLRLSRGGVWGEARYGNSFTVDPSVVFPRGSAAQGTPIDFAARGAELRALSAQLATLPSQGTTTIEPWGGILLQGTDPQLNVFQVNASAFTGAALLSISAPAGSLAVINISGGAATFTGFGQTFSGGIDQHGVLFNFAEASSIDANGYGFWGTVLAPYAHVRFSNGSFDGGIYALSLTGNAEGHINTLHDRDICL